MKLLFVISNIFLVQLLYAQVTVNVKWSDYKPPATSDTIYYNASQKLTWQYFKGKPEKGSPALAITSSGFGYDAFAKRRNSKVDINVTVYCYFNKNQSWVIKGKENDYALNHEQHHFDISWIVANNFFTKLKTASFTWQNYNQVLDKIYNDSMKELQRMQNEYDGQTSNGRIVFEQDNWNKKIETQLKAIPTN
jgi:hypothetical protein